MFVLLSVTFSLAAFFTLLIIPGCFRVAMPFAIFAIFLAIVAWIDEDVSDD
jgi:hypothetical protein